MTTQSTTIRFADAREGRVSWDEIDRRVVELAAQVCASMELPGTMPGKKRRAPVSGTAKTAVVNNVVDYGQNNIDLRQSPEVVDEQIRDLLKRMFPC